MSRWMCDRQLPLGANPGGDSAPVVHDCGVVAMLATAVVTPLRGAGAIRAAIVRRAATPGVDIEDARLLLHAATAWKRPPREQSDQYQRDLTAVAQKSSELDELVTTLR